MNVSELNIPSIHLNFKRIKIFYIIHILFYATSC